MARDKIYNPKLTVDIDVAKGLTDLTTNKNALAQSITEATIRDKELKATTTVANGVLASVNAALHPTIGMRVENKEGTDVTIHTYPDTTLNLDGKRNIPTQDYHVTDKKYVDDKVNGSPVERVDFTTAGVALVEDTIYISTTDGTADASYNGISGDVKDGELYEYIGGTLKQIPHDEDSGIPTILLQHLKDKKRGQASTGIAIGTGSGEAIQEEFSIAIGVDSGKVGQGRKAIAIGYEAGEMRQKANTIAIGANSLPIKEGDINLKTTTTDVVFSGDAMTINGKSIIAGIGGTTAERPTNPQKFSMYFDTTLNKLIVNNGIRWVDTNGTPVEIKPHVPLGLVGITTTAGNVVTRGKQTGLIPDPVSGIMITGDVVRVFEPTDKLGTSTSKVYPLISEGGKIKTHIIASDLNYSELDSIELQTKDRDIPNSQWTVTQTTGVDDSFFTGGMVVGDDTFIIGHSYDVVGVYYYRQKANNQLGYIIHAIKLDLQHVTVSA